KKNSSTCRQERQDPSNKIQAKDSTKHIPTPLVPITLGTILPT
ncbi:21145_t:CDS:1, partial [Gigaspora rosea]